MNSDSKSSKKICFDSDTGNLSSNSNHTPLKPSNGVNDQVLTRGGMLNGGLVAGERTPDMITDQGLEEMAADQATQPISSEVNRYFNEPMLIRESTDDSLPQKIVEFYREVEVKSSFGALAVLLKVLMNELGYVEADKAAFIAGINILDKEQTFRINFIYPTLDKSSFSLLLLPVCKKLFIHGLVKLADEESMRVKLPVKLSDFVNSDVSSDIYATYKGSKLPKFSRSFKDSVAYPMLQHALSASGFCSKPSLLTLVSELQIAIFKHLDIASLLCLSEVCDQLNAISKDRSIWKHVLLRDFGKTGISAGDLGQDCAQLYKKKYTLKKNVEKARSRVHFPFPGYMQPPIVPFGGDDDLYPVPFDPRYPTHHFNPPLGPSYLPFPSAIRRDPALDSLYGYEFPSVRRAVRRGPFGSGAFAGGPSFGF